MGLFKLGIGLTIAQVDGVMKVGTDGLLLAAWTRIGEESLFVLDVGAGTGLIGCVFCKENPNAKVEAIDSSFRAVELCRENMRVNELDRRYLPIHIRFEKYIERKDIQGKYDLIVSNPPFYQEDVKSPFAHRQESRHLDALPLDQLVHGCHTLLRSGGRLSVILPISAGRELERLGHEKGWHTRRKTTVIPKVGRPPHRWLLEMVKDSESLCPVIINTLIIRDQTDSYHKDYIKVAGRLHDRNMR